MAKRRTYKRDRRGRFSETLGSLASKAKARGNRNSLVKAIRGKGRKQGAVQRKINRIESDMRKTDNYRKGWDSDPSTANDDMRPNFEAILRQKSTQISNLKTYGSKRAPRRKRKK